MSPPMMNWKLIVSNDFVTCTGTYRRQTKLRICDTFISNMQVRYHIAAVCFVRNRANFVRNHSMDVSNPVYVLNVKWASLT